MCRVIFKGWWRQFTETVVGGPGSPDQDVGQNGHQNQGTRAKDGGSSGACLNLEKQQGIDGQR